MARSATRTNIANSILPRDVGSNHVRLEGSLQRLRLEWTTERESSAAISFCNWRFSAEGGFVIAWFLKTVSELLAGWKDGRAAERLASYKRNNVGQPVILSRRVVGEDCYVLQHLNR